MSQYHLQRVLNLGRLGILIFPLLKYDSVARIGNSNCSCPAQLLMHQEITLRVGNGFFVV